MRVLVTGHLGYIGPVMVTELREAGHDVVGLDSGLFQGCELERIDVPAIRRDLRDVRRDDVQGFEAIIHLAGLSNDPLGLLDPGLTYDVNARATVHLAQVAREAGVRRFLNSSSCSVYGAPLEEWVDESSKLRPVTPYGESKALAEKGLRMLAGRSFCVTSFRNATAFGYSPGLRADLVVNDFVAGAYLNGAIRLSSDGSAWRPLVHVRDIARAFLLGLTAPAEAVNGAVLNIGADDQNFRVIEIAQTVADLIPGSSVSVTEGAADRRSYRVRFELVRRVLRGFECEYGLRRGVQDLLDNFARLGLGSTEGLVRLGHLQRLIAAGEVDSTLRLAAGALSR